MMMKEEVGGGGGGGWPRACDTCQLAPCTVYCRADSAYLCSNCDARVHAANEVASRHERVWVCEACERAPAAFLCKADAASLCVQCDADIHSANPLARRHHRVPIMPVSGYLHPRSQVAPWLYLGDRNVEEEEEEEERGRDEEEEAASWLILNNPSKNNNNNNNNSNHNANNGFLLEGEVDGYLDLFDYNCEQFTTTTTTNNNNNNNNQKQQQQQQKEEEEFSVPEKSCGGDSVVPVQCFGEGKELQYQNFLFGMECDTSKSGYSYGTSFSHSVSVSSMDVGVVPESSMSDMSLSHSRPPKGTIDLFSGPPIQMPTQLSPMDREARVMRYREKKKTRKFEKTIRYASRKAYAETRPRIKGRFAKRTDVEAEMDQMFPNSLIGDGGYGIVPSF